jgi:tRNA(Ile)-lysidine synthase
VPLWFNSDMPVGLNPAFDKIDRSQPVIVGLSGGADSVTLLGLLHEAGFRMEAAHLNHRLRLEADSDADHASKIAEKLGIPFVVESVDVADYASEHGLSIEEAARKCRYQFLFETARTRKAKFVAVAHTADDQIETILMHLIRGAGLTGIKGMTPTTRLPEFDSEITLIRPILHLWRSDTEAFCRQNNLEFIVDASNTDQTFIRNRLRHSLIPDLETYNPQFKKALLRMSHSLQDDYEILNSLIDRVWADSIAEQGEGLIVFKLPMLVDSEQGMRRHLFKRAMHLLRPGLRDVDYDVLALASQFVDDLTGKTDASPSRKIDLTGGLYIYKEDDRLYLAQYEADLPSGDWPQLDSQRPVQAGATNLDKGWQLVVEKVIDDDLLSAALSNEDPLTVWMDAGKATGNLSIRPVQNGDAFQPLGMNGKTMKLSDFFINIKLPHRSRTRWPVLMVGEQIAWVMGLRLAHPYRVERGTRQALRLHLKRLP